MRIVLIGAGRLACNLGPVLCKAGYELSAIYSRHLASALRLQKECKCPYVTCNMGDLPKEADMFIIAVKDDALEDVIRQVTVGRENQLFVHTAGSMPLSLFEGYCRHYGVFYPMQTFSYEQRVDFNSIPLFLEADSSETMCTLQLLAKGISNSIYSLTTEERKYLHMAAVFACNFSNHCYALAADILKQVGLSFDIMLPLIEQTVHKVHELSPAAGQTGPAVRNDMKVMKMQHELLADYPTMQRIYDLLSASIYEKAIKQ